MEDEILSRNPLGKWETFPAAPKPAGVHPHDGRGLVDGKPAGTVRGRLGGRHCVFVQCSPETSQERSLRGEAATQESERAGGRERLSPLRLVSKLVQRRHWAQVTHRGPAASEERPRSSSLSSGLPTIPLRDCSVAWCTREFWADDLLKEPTSWRI